MMTIIRSLLSAIILFWDKFFPAKIEYERSSEKQAQVDQATRAMSLYQFQGCPFCVKVRRNIRRLGLKIENRNVNESETFRDELLKGGGMIQVPCLRLETPEGVKWMYESSDINQYLETRFAKL